MQTLFNRLRQFGVGLERHPLRLAVIVALVALINSYFHLRTPRDWWFEDDPVVYAAASTTDHVVNFFIDPKAQENGVGQNEMAQILLASFWIDHVLSPRDPRISYSHTAWIYALTAALFFNLLRRILGSNRMALFGAVVWLFLPTITVINEFLSTRHYMYGMLFALASLELAEYAMAAKRFWSRLLLYTLLLASMSISLIAKELFPPVLLTVLFLRFAARKVWVGCALCVADAGFYTAYRFWMTDPGLTYRSMPLPSVGDIFLFFSRIPYSFFGGFIGYGFLLLAIVVQIRNVATNRSQRIPGLIFTAGLTTAIATVIPVMSALIATWQTYGPWYRTPLVIHTLLLVMLLSALHQIRNPKLKTALCACVLIAGIAGGHRTARHWDRLKRAQRSEGEFFLENPGKTLFTWTEAFWYFHGLRQLYPEVQTAETVSRWPNVPATARERLLGLETVWTMRDGKILPLNHEQVVSLLSTIP